MLTRCPECATTFRVTPEQLKVRAGKVRCGECQHVFNALDTLIEEPILVHAPAPVIAQPEPEEIAVPPAPTFVEVLAEPEGDVAAPPPPEQEAAPVEDVASEPEPEPQPPVEPEPVPIIEEPEPLSDFLDAEASPPSRRWPWLLGGVLALAVMAIQLVLAFRVELAVLMPDTRPILVALCDIAGCDVGLPKKVELVGIETSDLHPDTEKKGQLALTATLKNRAPFAQEFPLLELTLTDTADKAIARKVLAPIDYLPVKTKLAKGMPANADLAITVGIDPKDLPASGYRLYLFYP